MLDILIIIASLLIAGGAENVADVKRTELSFNEIPNKAGLSKGALHGLTASSHIQEVLKAVGIPSNDFLSTTKFIPMETAKVATRSDIQKLKRADRNYHHKVIFATAHKNLDKLENILLDVSNPLSFSYGKFLTADEVRSLTANPESVKHIIKFLEHNNIKVLNTTLNGEFITAEARISKWEEILQAEFFEYCSGSDSNLRFHRTLQYSLPENMVKHVSAVFNTVQFPDSNSILHSSLLSKKLTPTLHQEANRLEDTPRRKQVKNTTQYESLNARLLRKVPSTEVRQIVTTSNEIFGYVTPALLNRYYNIDSNSGRGYGSQAVYETIGQSFSPSDLSYFQNYFGLPVEAVAVDIGGHESNRACSKNNGQDCIEANLDVQYMMAVAQRVPTTYYYWAGEDFLLDWAMQVANMASPPLVFSISYGIDEAALPASYGAAFDAAAMKLGVMGVTILASSGDDGAISSSARNGPLYCGYNPSFPATSPYVTAVGGTMVRSYY